MEKMELQTVKPAEPEVVPGFFSAAAIKQLQTITTIFNKSTLVPETYRGEQNFGNCAIVLAMAARMKADPLMMLQNVYVVYGTPALSSKMMIALFNTCGRFGSIHYKETGQKGTDSQGVIAWAKELATGDVVEGPAVTIGVAKAEGWFNKTGTKWKTMPDQMLRYRAAAWFIRTTAPELTVGLQTVDEVQDIGPEGLINVSEKVREQAGAEANQTAIPLPNKQLEPEPILPAKPAAPATPKAAAKPAVKQKAAPAPAPAPEQDDGPSF